MTLKKDGILETPSFLDDIEFVFYAWSAPCAQDCYLDFYDLIVLHYDSYMSHRVLRVTQTMSHDLVMSNLYELRLSEERLYKEVKGPETRALHATI